MIDIGLEHAAFPGKEFLVDVPELCNLLAMLRNLQITVVWQAGAGGPFPGAHGIALTGNGQAGATRLADIAGDQGQVVDAHHAIRTMGGLVDAHGPDLHGGAGTGETPGHVADGILIDAADLCHGGGIVFLHLRFQVFETVGIGIDIVLVLQAFLEDDVHQGVLQHHVRTRRDGQVNVRVLRQHGDAGIDHDERETFFSWASFMRQ